MTQGGPATQEGKEVVKWNAARHGIRSPAPIVPGVEKKENWEAHGHGVLESLQPEGDLELVLAEGWRCSPGASIASPATRQRASPSSRRRLKTTWQTGGVSAAACWEQRHPEDVRGNLKMARSDYRLLKRFPKLEEDQHLSSFDADRTLWAVMEVTDRVAEGEVAPEDLLEEISIPGVPDNTQEWEDYDGWNAGAVRAGMDAPSPQPPTRIRRNCCR